MTIPSHASLMALELPELRRRLVAHLGARPDPFDAGMAEWIDTKGALTFAIDRKEGELRSPAFFITVPRQPMEGLALKTEIKLHAGRPTGARRAPIHSDEVPMPRPTPPPPERLEALQNRLATAATPKAASIVRMQIRRHCDAHGLPLPPEAALQADCCPKGYRRTTAPAPATAPHASASPVAPAEHGAEPPRAQGAAHRPAPGAGEPAPTHSPAAARIRALRSQALEFLPELEDLTPEEATRAHEEMDLLAQTLVLGGKLIGRRTA